MPSQVSPDAEMEDAATDAQATAGAEVAATGEDQDELDENQRIRVVSVRIAIWV